MHKRQVYVIDLPNGYFKGILKNIVKDPATATVWVVAKEGYAKDWAAYIGFPILEQLQPKFQSSSNYEYYCNNVHFSNDVAAKGDKLSKAEAEELFPGLTHLRYRE